MISKRIVALSLLLTITALCGIWTPVGAIESDEQFNDNAPGDRIRMRIEPESLTSDIIGAAVPIGSDYQIGSGDILAVQVLGKGNLRYAVGGADGEDGSASVHQTTVTPSGEVILPLAGPVKAEGLTTGELTSVIRDKLSRYYRNPEVTVAIAQPRTTKIWVSGDVENPGPQVLPGTATALEAFLKAGVRVSGSTRNVRLTRKGETSRIDVYAMVMNGDLDQNVLLQPGDTLHVPVAKGLIEVEGEVARPGKYEPVSFSGGACRASDIVSLSMGLTPTAVPARATLERKDSTGSMSTVPLNLEKIVSQPDDPENIVLQDGDKVRVPAIGEFQSVVRMVGEFVGQDVYQRVIGGSGETQVLNKSGVYKLAQGETAGDVIRKTGGWTPQADLKRATLERRSGTGFQVLALDLEKVLVQNDRSADIVLHNGDTLILPAVLGKVQILGQVTRPGAYSYVPGRRLMDYIGEAGGPRARAKLSKITIIHPQSVEGSATYASVSRKASVSDEDNPVLSPGDIVFVPESFISDWRDIIQLLTSYRLIQTIF